ncbi:solute carrier family 2, facilitated glucose transporter member 7-like [Liasis olivaceus]
MAVSACGELAPLGIAGRCQVGGLVAVHTTRCPAGPHRSRLARHAEAALAHPVGFLLYVFQIKLQFLSLLKEESQKNPTFSKLLIFVAIALFPLGGLFGVFFCGALADRYGRKSIILINNGFSIISSAVLCLDRIIQRPEFILFARFFAGIGSGSFTCSIPLYILEISSLNLRGALVTASILFLNWGHILGQILTFPQIWGNREDYSLLVGITAVFAVISNMLLLLCPESPRYLYIQRNDEANARQGMVTQVWCLSLTSCSSGPNGGPGW